MYVEDEPSRAIANSEFKREPAPCGGRGDSCALGCCMGYMCVGNTCDSFNLRGDEPSHAFANKEFKREPASCGARGAYCAYNKDCCYALMCNGTPGGGPNNRCESFGYYGFGG